MEAGERIKYTPEQMLVSLGITFSEEFDPLFDRVADEYGMEFAGEAMSAIAITALEDHLNTRKPQPRLTPDDGRFPDYPEFPMDLRLWIRSYNKLYDALWREYEVAKPGGQTWTRKEIIEVMRRALHMTPVPPARKRREW